MSKPHRNLLTLHILLYITSHQRLSKDATPTNAQHHPPTRRGVQENFLDGLSSSRLRFHHFPSRSVGLPKQYAGIHTDVSACQATPGQSRQPPSPGPLQ